MPPGRSNRFGVIGPTIDSAARIVPSPPQTTNRSGASVGQLLQLAVAVFRIRLDQVRAMDARFLQGRALSRSRASAGTEPDFGLNKAIVFMGVQTFRATGCNAAARRLVLAGYTK